MNILVFHLQSVVSHVLWKFHSKALELQTLVVTYFLNMTGSSEAVISLGLSFNFLLVWGLEVPSWWVVGVIVVVVIFFLPFCRVLTIMHLKQTMFLGYFTTYTTLPPCSKICRVGNIQRWCVKMTSVSSFTAPCFVPFDGYGGRYARQSPFIWVNRSLNLDSRTMWPDLDYSYF